MDNEKTFDFLSEIEIDPNALDVEWLRQASLMYKASQLLAQARDAMDRAKNNIDAVTAEINLEIRKNPERYLGDIKVTEGSIQSALEQNKLVKSAREELDNRKFEFNMIFAGVTALEHKKSALENLVKLNGQSYFASPNAPRDLGKEWEDRIENKRETEKMKERKRERERKS
jgi:hypothetical protein